MRRSVVSILLVVFSFCLWPTRAEAFFWDWLDDLSGPRFWGFQTELQLWCRSEDAVVSVAFLDEVTGKLKADTTAYVTESGANPSNLALEAAVFAARSAEAHLRSARAQAIKGDNTGAASFYRSALNSWTVAASSYREGLRTIGDSKTREDKIRAARNLKPRMAAVGGGVGVAVSLCSSAPLQRTTRYIAVHYAYGWDHKNPEDANRMATIGMSMHSAVKPYLTVGAGGGVAFFTSAGVDGFHKLYVQPFIVDFRPFALLKPFGLVKEPDLKSPLRHVVYLRFEGIVFPAGFEPGRFGGDSPRFSAELTPSLGVYFDMAPLVRKWQNRW